MGIQVNPGHGKGSGPSKGTYLRLYSDFYISDIILASPIALKLVMESNPNKLDCDFLSSIEQVIVHQADVLSMQNWEHVDFVLRHLNQLPKDQHEETDFSRVRSYFLDGQGARYRQLMMLSAFNSPELQACFREFACCHRGQMRLKKDWEVLSPLALRTSQMTTTTQDTVMTLTESRGGGDGTINDVYVSAKQVFLHIPLPTSGENELRGTNMVEEAEERRFLYFKDQVLAPILRLKQARTMIVTPSYLDFVRVRNYLIEQECNAAYLSEYSSESDIARARSNFFQGVRDILLYSGRAHFFRRFKIRGARHVVFYSLPEYPNFYSEMVNMLAANYDDSIGLKKKAENEDDDGYGSVPQDKGLQLQEMSSLVMFTDFERMALERIVGTKKTQLMLISEKNTFVFF
jgi:U3 small nucleolar RNA-associated protein 25